MLAGMPLPSRVRQVPHDGLVFDVTDEGPLDGEVVVLLHGFPHDRTSWTGIAPLLHAAGYRTLALDQRGYSPRARPAGRAAYTSEKLVGDVLALADAAGAPRFHVVGHDWGGGVAWALGGAHQERVATVTSLSTPHPGALFAAVRSRDLDQLKRSWYMGFFQLPWLPERLLRDRIVRLLRGGGLPREVAEHYAARMAEPGALTAALNWYRAIPWSRNVARRCRVPATLVWGARDVALGRRAVEHTHEWCLAAYELVVLEDEGHGLPELAPQACADAILRRLAAPALPE